MESLTCSQDDAGVGQRRLLKVRFIASLPAAGEKRSIQVPVRAGRGGGGASCVRLKSRSAGAAYLTVDTALQPSPGLRICLPVPERSAGGGPHRRTETLPRSKLPETPPSATGNVSPAKVLLHCYSPEPHLGLNPALMFGLP